MVCGVGLIVLLNSKELHREWKIRTRSARRNRKGRTVRLLNLVKRGEVL